MPFSSVQHGKAAISWWDTTVPTTGPTGAATTWVGVRFHVTVAGRICGMRFYDGFANPDEVLLVVMDWATGNVVGSTSRTAALAKWFQWKTGSIGNQWQQTWVRPWFRPVVNRDYLVAAIYKGGGFFRTNAALAAPPVTHGHIAYMSSFQTTSLDLSAASLAENTNANAVDILFQED